VLALEAHHTADPKLMANVLALSLLNLEEHARHFEDDPRIEILDAVANLRAVVKKHYGNRTGGN